MPEFDPHLEPDRFELREADPYRFELDRREFLGAGLLLTLFVTREAASQRGGGEAGIEARLHLGEDGIVTVLSGKIEEGQGARAEIAMAAAEELGLPMSQVRVVLGDTERVPNDGITAGSRTTPFTIPAVRKAGAAAREILVQSGMKSYAELAKSGRKLEAAASASVTLRPVAEWRILGVSQQRPESRGLVTGGHQFPSDVRRPGMLYGAVLRPPAYGAKIESLDVAAARKLPGVVAVKDGDFAACAAPTSYQARKGVEVLAASVRWSAPEHKASSENLFEYLKQHQGRVRDDLRGEPAAQPGKRLTAEYRAAYVQHAPMEPRAAVAEWENGRLTVWTGTSNPFSVRDTLARTLSVNPAQVRVIVPDFGGGFGGKHTGEAAIEAARLAKEAGKPVSLRWTRAEEFALAYCRPAALIEVEAALSDGATITAWDFANYNSGASALASPYRLAHARHRYIECESPLRPGSYRALASTVNNFAREAFMDELAEAAGKDPLDFRLAHLDNARIRAVLEEAAERFGWRKRVQQRTARRGVGLACGTEKNSVVAACVEIEIDPVSGAPRLVEIVQAYECGKILNPANLRQQVEGCILMGLGAVLRERLEFSRGIVTNGSFARYRVPRFRDVPKIDLILMDRPDMESIGAGETPIIAVAPAMANAFHNATGQRAYTLPLPPAKQT
jgi:isoquinoline 1-oxidoreductase subunit beta